jgi:hypothetical protein
MAKPMTSLRLALGLALVLCACRQPQPQPQAPAKPTGPAPRPATPPATGAKPGFKPQFTFASWTQAAEHIRNGDVIETVSGHGGFSLILKDHTWVRPVSKPGDPLPRNPMEFLERNAPNAKSIRHTKE